MKLFAFKRIIRQNKKYIKSPDPVIIYDHEIESFKMFKIYTIWFLSFVAIMFFLREFGTIVEKETKPERKYISSYMVCGGRESIKYYDRELDLVLMNPGYSYCEEYPYQNNNVQNLHGSCIDTGCKFVEDFERKDKEFYSLVGKRYFIR